MAQWKSKTEKLQEWTPNDAAWKATEKAFQELKNAKEQGVEELNLEFLSEWFDRNSSAGYRNLVYTIWFVNSNLTPVWLGGSSEIPQLQSQVQKANSSGKGFTVVSFNSETPKPNWASLL